VSSTTVKMSDENKQKEGNRKSSKLPNVSVKLSSELALVFLPLSVVIAKLF
jgi:hypothetical protein